MIAAASAVLLIAAALAAWFVAAGSRPAARVHLRFASVLLVSPAAAALAMPAAAPEVASLVMPIALIVLALATAAGLAKALVPALAALILMAASLSALAAAVTGWIVLALAPALLGVAAIVILCLRRFDDARLAALQGFASALCFLAAASAFVLDGVGAALLLFSAAGLLGLTLALSRSGVAVVQRAGPDLRGVAIARRHAR
jgi:alpha-1,6-mannosyltransferase